jgi:putative addiction module component (TIGR02574 family)
VFVSSTAKKILDEALALPEEDRGRLAERLLESVPRESADDVERAWDQEVLRRVKAAENGETEARDWDQAAAGLRAKYTKK